jgi:hypothetical protein
MQLVCQDIEGVLHAIIVKAAITGKNKVGHGEFKVGCDNTGVVWHGNNPNPPMLDKQPQSDVMWYFKGLMANFQIGGRMQHVYWRTKCICCLQGELIAVQTNLQCRRSLRRWKKTNSYQVSSHQKRSVWKSLENRPPNLPKNLITDLWGKQVAWGLYDRWGVI